MNIKSLLCAWATFALAFSALAGTGGNCQKNAQSLSASQSVKLVAEYDPDEKEYWEDSGVAYFKVKLSKGSEATIWISGGASSELDISVDTDMDSESFVGFDPSESFSGGVQACYLYSDSWDEEYDPSSETFYVCISGDVGQQTSLYFQKSIKTFTIAGEYDSPISLTMKTKEQNYGGTMVTEGGETWFKAKLTAGAAYQVRTARGSAKTKALDIDFDATTLDIEEDFAYELANTNNVKYWVYPETTATYKFCVSGDEKQAYTLYYRQIPARTPEQHAYQELAESNSYAVALAPGRLCATREYYDAIPDESLARMYVKKGQRVVFETSGAATQIRLVAFDAKGTQLVANETMGNANNDCRVAFQASADGYYYLGVYDPNLGPEDEPGAEKVTLSGAFCDAVPAADDWDPADDAVTGASQLIAAPATSESSVFDAAVTVAHGPHAFNAGDWYDVYAISCRKGVTYRLRAAFADDGSTTDLTLAAKVFTVAKSKETALKTTGSLFADSSAEALTFTATDNGTVYVRVQVAEGVGLTFPEHLLYAVAYKDAEATLGWLQVLTKGAEGNWHLGSEKVNYANGAVVNVVGSQTVTFGAVSGFATPVAVTTNVVAGVGIGAGLVQVTGIYNDSYDRYQVTRAKKKIWVSDDETSGAVALGLTKTAKEYPRTLWKADPRDLFSFTSKAGVYYDFELVDTTLDGTGDAQFEIVDAENVVLAGPMTKLEKTQLAAGALYLRVRHADPSAPVDASYRLVASSHDAGTIKFKQAAYSVSENSAYATLTLVRSASEGVVRVRWATAAGTDEDEQANALPGRDYYPADGEVVWADGDKKDKTIQVRLIPDLKATREENRKFFVNLAVMDADDLEDGEYLAQLADTSASVTVVEATAAAGGTVSAVSYGSDDTPIASAKKPVAYATAGGVARIKLRRSAFTSDTRIAVRAVAVTNAKKYKDTAKSGIDYEAYSQVIEWEAGDGDDKEIAVHLLESSDLTVSKQFTVTLTALTKDGSESYDKATLSAAAVTVKIANDTVSKSFSTVAKEMKTDGIAATAKGSWYADADGALTCEKTAAASMTFQVTGPGLFVANPSVSGCGTLTCRVGSGETAVCSGKTVLIVPAGKQKVVFALTDGEDESSVSFDVFEDGKSYRWTPFADVVPVDPYYNANVTVLWPSLTWSVPEALEREGVVYRVRLGQSKKPTEVLGTNLDETTCAIPDETLVAGKTWYWALDYACPEKGEEPSEEDWTAGPSVWSFTTVSADSQRTVVVGTDAYGEDFYESITNNLPIELLVGVKADFEIGPSAGDSVKSRVLSGSLPPGLKLDGAAKKGTITGTPTKAGVYTALLQTATGTAKKPVWATTQRLTFNVTELGTAVGTFRGTLREDGTALERMAARVGGITFTTSAAGKLSANVTVAGRTYRFSGTGYDAVIAQNDGADGADKTLSVTLTEKEKYGSTTYLNELVIELPDGCDASAQCGELPTARLHLYVPTANGKALSCETDYSCSLYRAPEASDTLKKFAGYYTVSLVAPDVTTEDGVPAGNGYLTLTVSDLGAVKVAGRLADGTSVSASTQGALLGDAADPASCEMIVPLAVGSSAYALGGELCLLWSADTDDTVTTTVDPAFALEWYKDGTSATRDGDPLSLELSPAGGFYNTVWNLQTYYLNRDFTLDGVEVLLQGNAVVLAGTKGESVSDMKYSLARATGLATGTLTYAGTKKISHYGVLTMNRAVGSPLADDIWTAGFFLHKVSKTWTESIPFGILMSPDELDRDWSETEFPEAAVE